jgi:hypothetical protein
MKNFHAAKPGVKGRPQLKVRPATRQYPRFAIVPAYGCANLVQGYRQGCVETFGFRNRLGQSKQQVNDGGGWMFIPRRQDFRVLDVPCHINPISSKRPGRPAIQFCKTWPFPGYVLHGQRIITKYYKWIVRQFV